MVPANKNKHTKPSIKDDSSQTKTSQTTKRWKKNRSKDWQTHGRRECAKVEQVWNEPTRALSLQCDWHMFPAYQPESTGKQPTVAPSPGLDLNPWLYWINNATPTTSFTPGPEPLSILADGWEETRSPGERCKTHCWSPDKEAGVSPLTRKGQGERPGVLNARLTFLASRVTDIDHALDWR